MSWCDLDMTFDHAVLTLTYNILSGLYLGNHKVQEVILGRHIGWGVACM